MPFLKAQLRIIKPKVIIALGKIAADGFLGFDPKRRLGDVRGNWDNYEGFPIMVTYHPSYLLHNPSKTGKRKVWEDMLKVMEQTGKSISEKQLGFFSDLLDAIFMSVQKILLVLGGDPPSEDLLRWRIEESDLSVAVDSGWLAFRHAGLIPDILIGDMDSWQGVESDVPNSVEWIIEKDQEKTDFQKAIQWVLSCENPKELVVLGGAWETI